MTLVTISNNMKYSSDLNLENNQNDIASKGDRFTKQIVFIDSQVEDYQFLAAGVLSGIEVVVLDSHKDGIEQITAALSQRNFTSIHIVSHGSPGCLYLGNSQLSLDTLNKYRTQLQTWFAQSLSLPFFHSPSLLLYGCNVAAGDAGEEFIYKLHNLTGAEIAASTTPVGNSQLGGNWELDVSTSQLSAKKSLAFKPDTLEHYRATLDLVDANFQPLKFNNTPTLVSESGTALKAGAQYRFQNVITVDGTTVDAIVNIDAITGGAVIQNIDSNTRASSDPTNKADYFAPVISATNNPGRVDFSITFLDAADNSSVTLQNFRLNSIDIDGAEFVEYGNFDAFTVAQNTDLVITQQNGRTRFRATGNYNLGLEFNDEGRVQAQFNTAEVVQLSMGLASASSNRQFGSTFETANFTSPKRYQNPTVESQTTTDTTPVIKGTVGTPNLQPSESLTVTVNGVSYNNSNPELVISGGNWTLTIPDNNAITPSADPLEVNATRTFFVTNPGNNPAQTISLSDRSSNELLINDAPDLDLDNSANGNNYRATFLGDPIAIASNPIISDSTDTNLESATITLTNARAGDLLSGDNLPTGTNISIDPNNSTNTRVTLIGTGTIAQYQAAIAAITFNNTESNPDTSDRNIEVVVNDGDDNSNTAIATIQWDTDRDGIVNSIDLDDDNDGILDSVENNGDNTRDTDGDSILDRLDIDADDDGIPDNVEAQTTANYIAPSDSDDDGDGLDNSYDADDNSTDAAASQGLNPVNTDNTDNVDYLDADSDNDGTSDLEENGFGVATIDPNAPDTDGDGLKDAFETASGSTVDDGFDVNDAIDDPNPSTLPDTDGDLAADGNDANPTVKDLDYRDNAFRPELDLDGDAPGNGYETTFSFGNPVGVADTDATIFDNDDTNIESATITLIDPRVGDFLIPPGNTLLLQNGISASISPDLSQIVLTGSATKAEYVEAIAAVQYNNGETDANRSDRTIEIFVEDEEARSNTAITTVTYANVPPRIDLNGDAEGNNYTDTFTEGNDPVSVAANTADVDDITENDLIELRLVVDPNTVNDGENEVLTVNEVVIPLNDDLSDDTTSVGGVPVTISYTANNGEITVVPTDGTTPLPQEELDTLVRGITYENTSQDPTQGDRTLTFSVTDEDGAISNSPTSTITVAAVNDPPLVDLNGDAEGNDYVDAFTEGNDPIAVAANTADVNDLTENDLIELRLVVDPNTVEDGENEVLSVNGISIALNADQTNTETSVGGVPVTITYTASNGELTVVPTDGTTPLPQEELDTLVRGITYENSSQDPTSGDRTLTFSVTDEDNATSNFPTSTITVAAVNDPPLVDLNGEADGNNYADTFTEGNDPIAVAANTADVDDITENDLIELRLVVDPNTVEDGENEVLSVNGISIPLNADQTNSETTVGGVPVTITYTASNGELTVVPTDGTTPLPQDQLDTLVRGITYENTSQDPTPGDRTLTFSVTDEDNATSNSPTSTITVEPVNDPPVAQNDSLATNEDTAVTFDPLENDSDVDGNLVPTSVVFVETPTGSTLSDNGKILTVPDEGTYSIADDGRVTFTPVDNFNGTPTPVTYQVADNDGATATAQINLTVTDVNDPPVTQNDSATTDEDSAVTLNILENDSDVDGNLVPASVVFVDAPNNGTIIDAGKTLTVDGEGTYKVAENGQVTFTPVDNFNGTPTPVTYQVSDDDGATDTAQINLAVNDVNDPPVAQNDSATTDEDSVVTLNILENDSDVDGNLIPTSVVFVEPPTNSTLSDDGKTLTVPDEGTYSIADDGQVTFTPVDNFNGTPTPVTYQVSDDDGAIDTAQINLTVNDLNDPPVAEDDAATTDEDTAVEINILENDSDVDGNLIPTSVVFVETPTGSTLSNDGKTLTVPDEGTYSIADDGRVTFTPVDNFNGTPTPVTYQVSDDDGATDTAQINLAVNDLNDPPVAEDDSPATDEDTVVTFNPLENDLDVDGNLVPSSVIFVEPPTGSTLSQDGKTLTVPGEGTYSIDENGQVTYTPVDNFNGTATPVTYQVSDDDGATATAQINPTVQPVNDPPVAEDDLAITDEDVAVKFNPLTNDTDIDGTLDPTSVVFVSQPDGATVSDDNKTLTVPGEGEYIIDRNTGEITFTPEASYSGATTPVEYQVSDNDGGADTATISINVNDAPVAVNDTVTTNIDDPVTFNPLENDSDSDGNLNPASLVFINPPNDGTINDEGKTLTVTGQGTYSIAEDGRVTFTPETGYNGIPAPVTYQVADNNGAVDTATISININNPPITRNDSGTTTENATVVFNPLANDSDIDGNLVPESVVFVNPPTDSDLSTDGKTLTVTGEGTYNIADNGEITFTPATDYSGTTTPITYRVTDNNNATNTAQISLTVSNAPVALDDTPITNENTLITFNPLANDSGGDGTLDPISVIFVNPPQGATRSNENKTLTVPGQGEYVIADNGDVTFTPETGFNGTPTPVEYQVSDNLGASDTGTISVTINDSPVAEDDLAITDENIAITFNPLTNDRDSDGRLIRSSVIFVSQPEGSTLSEDGKILTVPGQGEYAIAFDSGEVTFTPEAGYSGAPTPVEYRVSDDNNAFDTATISIIVNDTPVANDDTAITNIGVPVTINPLDNDTDSDGELNPASLVFINPPDDGTITDGGKTLTVTGQGIYTIAENGEVIFDPEDNFEGVPAPVTYQVADDRNAIATATISVAINNPPVTEDDTVTTNENTLVTFNPLENDTDNDGNLVPSSVIFVEPPQGATLSNNDKTLVVAGEGTYNIADNGEITFTPETDYSGAATPVTYRVTDNNGATNTAEISVTVSDAPIAEDDTVTTNENTPVTFNPLENDSSGDGNFVPSSLVFVNPPADSELSPDGKTLTVTGEGTYTIADNGDVEFTPEAGYDGTATFVDYQVTNDNNASDTGTISVFVNNAPVADNDLATTDEDAEVTIDLLSNDTDSDGTLDPTSVIFVETPEGSTLSDDGKTLTVPDEGEYAIAPDGQVTFTPVADFNGTPTPVTYQVSDDDGATDTAQINLTVTDVNDSPVAEDDSPATDEDIVVTFNPLENDSDVDGNLVPGSVVFVEPPTDSTLSDDGKILTVPDEGTYSIDENGQVTFTPVDNFNGTPTPVTYQVSDDDGATDTAQINLTVQPVNDPPIAENDLAVTDEDIAVTFNPLTNDSDIDGTLDPTSVVFVSQPDGATVSEDNKTLTVPGEGEYVIDSASGEITFTPEASYSGTTTPVEYQVSDNDGGADTATVSVDVNDAPVAKDDTVTTNIGVPVTINPLDNDTDSDGEFNPASLVFINPPDDGTINDEGKTLTVTGQGVYSIADNGVVTFDPEANFDGVPAPVTYQVADNRGAIATATISVTINKPPIIEDDSATTIENAEVTFNPLANDSDIDGNLVPGSVIFVEAPQDATLSNDDKTLTVPNEGTYVIAENGEITFTPEPDYSGTATTVTYQVADNNNATNRAQIFLTVSDAPVAEDDSPITNRNTPITFNPLANDSGGDGTLDPASVVFVSPPQGATRSDDGKTLSVPGQGEYVIAENGEVTFTPELDYNGTLTPVEYRVSDNLGASDTGIISARINNPPVAEDDAAVTDENVAIAFNPLTNDTDSDGTLDPASVVFVNTPQGATLSDDGKTLTVTGEGEYAIAPDSGEVTFTPVPDYSGISTPVEYRVSDNNDASDVGEIVIQVNDAPVANDDTVTTNIGVPVTINPLDNDTDSDGELNPASLVFINPPDDGTITDDGKTLTVIGQGVYNIADNGVVTFNPEANFEGVPAPVTYQVADDRNAIATATISVAINNPPVTEDDTVTTNENTLITFNPLENDTDSDGNLVPSSVIFVESNNGTITEEGKTLTVTGEGIYRIAEDGQITFTPETNYNGTATPVTYQVSDDFGATNTANILMTVSDAPIAEDDTVITNEDTVVIFNPLENDSSGDGNFVPSSLVFVNQPENGAIADEGKTLTVTGEGIYRIADNGEITFTPDSGYSGTATSVDYRVTNDNNVSDIGTISVTVNDAPVANNDTATTNEDAEVTIDLLSNDTDSDGTLDPTSVIFVNSPDNATLSEDRKTLTVPEQGTYAIAPDGQVTFTPVADYSGTPTPVTYQVSDDNGAVDTATLSVTVNDAPVAENDTATTNRGTTITIDPLANDTDSDGTLDPSSVVFVSPPENGTITDAGKTLTVTGEGTYGIADNGQITFDPEPNFDALATPVTYRVADNEGATDTAEISISINNSPVLDLDGDAPGNDYQTIFSTGEEAISITNNTAITDVDDDNIESATVTLIDPQNGDLLLINGTAVNDGDSITINGIEYNATVSNEEVVVELSNTATKAEYQTAIAAITFDNTELNPERGDRVIEFVVSDGSTDSNIANTVIKWDSDGDGIADTADIDDDNDGILDITESDLFVAGSDSLNPGTYQEDTDLSTGNTTSLPGFAPAGDNAFTFGAELQGTSAWANGIQIISDFGVDEILQLQPDSTNFNTGDTVVYTLTFEQPVYDLSLVMGGFNFGDTAQFEAFNGAEPVSLTSANFQNIDPDLIEIAPNTYSSPVEDGGADPTVNDLTLDIDTPITQVQITTGKLDGSPGNVTLGLHTINYLGERDIDNDGFSDRLDIDADNDGIPDNVEAQTTAGYIAPSNEDDDNDGLDNNYDLDNSNADAAASEGLTPVNTDAEDRPDYLDTNSDNDLFADVEENGMANAPSGTDTDGDGLDDAFETANGSTVDDGFDVNDAIDSPVNGILPDTDNDVAADGNDATPLVRDLDYRDLPNTPALDLDADNSSGAVDNDYQTTFTENVDAVNIADEDASVNDFNENDLVELKIEIDPDNIPDGAAEVLNVNGLTIPLNNNFSDNSTTVGGVAVNIDYDSDAGILTVVPTDNATSLPQEELDNSIRGITYENTSEDPTIGDRTLTFTVTDNSDLNSVPAVSTVTVAAQNDAPTLDLDDDDSSGAVDSNYINLTTGTPVAIADSDTTISDIDDENIESATVTLTNSFVGDELLVDGTNAATGGDFTTNNGNTISYSATDSNEQIVVTLNGAAPLADYQEIIEAIAFNNTASNPNRSDRVIEVVVNDGDINSNTAISTIQWDSDGDGVADFEDLDDDNDGTVDSEELPEGLSADSDSDGDGILDYQDPDSEGLIDENNDGIDDRFDTDGDGIIDTLDLDSDNDGITDVTEAGGTDTNGDGIIDDFSDEDNDGLDDDTANNPLDNPDTDGDGIADAKDLDSDNDGITDLIEAGGTDNDGDGVIDDFSDTNNDGLDDSTAESPLDLPNSDNDGLADYLDIDSDNDGIPDNVEAQTTENYVAPTGNDADGDGLDNAYDIDSNAPALTPVNTDEVDEPDYLDIDSDNDLLLDIEENGMANAPSGNDTDSDGLDDAFEGSDADDGYDVNDEIDNPSQDLPDTQNPGGDVDYRQALDSDGDGVADVEDLDDDNDGIVDAEELPEGLSADSDSDGDGVLDYQDPDSEGFIDENNDGIDDRFDNDGDGIIDTLDLDSDNDGITDVTEAGGEDANGDGIIDGFADENNDGLDDETANNPLANPDNDGDNVVDAKDLDSDNDGIPDNVEAQTTTEYIAPVGEDSDNDGLDNAYDPDSNASALDPVNSDGVDEPDYLDTDSDNDSLLDIEENGMADTPSGTDTDGDGLDNAFEGSNADDGYDANDEIDNPLDSILPDSDGDASAGTPLVADLDYRDRPSIEGQVWEDTDRNGINGEFEPGVANVAVTLIGKGDDGEFGTDDDTTENESFTDADGNYEFTGLIPGTEYQVNFDLSNLSDEFTGEFTAQNVGDDRFDSDVNPETGTTPAITSPSVEAIFTSAGLLTPEAVSSIQGSASPDELIGTPLDDEIAGYKGQDTLTGGEGSDRFLYNETSDGVDIITDFTSGEDEIVLTQILQDELNYTGNNPIEDGLVVIEDYGSVGTMIQIDFDADGDLLPKDVVFLDGVSSDELNADDLAF